MELSRLDQKIRYHGSMRDYIPLLLLLIAYLAVGTLFAQYTPAWQAPDEPAHYNYIRQLAEGTWPVIQPQDYDENYRRKIVDKKFAPPLSIEPLTYEDWQPPLYYLLLTPVFLAFDGALLPLRLFTVLIGACTILLAYGIARQIWPNQRWLASLATAFVAFLPQHVAMVAAVNNDSLAELFIGLLLLFLLLHVSPETDTPYSDGRRWFSMGILLGLGLLVKATVYIMIPVIAAALLWAYWQCWGKFIRNSALCFIPAFLLGLPWWLRNLIVYDGFDPMAIASHNAVVVGQIRTTEWLTDYGLWGTLQRFSRTTFQSFWGQFGWMGVLMDARIYLLLLIFSILVIIGLLWALFRGMAGKTERSTKDAANGRYPERYAILAMTFALSLLLYLGYNLTFVQHQGRYLFPALIPISIGVAVGIHSWAVPIISRIPALRLLLTGLFVLGLIGLDLLALFYFIIPQLTIS